MITITENPSAKARSVQAGDEAPFLLWWMVRRKRLDPRNQACYTWNARSNRKGAGAADGGKRDKEHKGSQGTKEADAHVSARIAPGRGSSAGQTTACAPGSRQTVLQCAALRRTKALAADAGRSQLASSSRHPSYAEAGTGYCFSCAAGAVWVLRIRLAGVCEKRPLHLDG